MSTMRHVEQPNAKTLKYVYFFGGGEAEGKGEMKDALGEKGARLAEMTNAGLPVPPGFTNPFFAVGTEMHRPAGMRKSPQFRLILGRRSRTTKQGDASNTPAY